MKSWSRTRATQVDPDSLVELGNVADLDGDRLSISLIWSGPGHTFDVDRCFVGEHFADASVAIGIVSGQGAEAVVRYAVELNVPLASFPDEVREVEIVDVVDGVEGPVRRVPLDRDPTPEALMAAGHIAMGPSVQEHMAMEARLSVLRAKAARPADRPLDADGGRNVTADEAGVILAEARGFDTRFAVAEDSLTIWFDWPSSGRRFSIDRAILDMDDMSVMLVSMGGWGPLLHDGFNVDEWIRDNVRCDEATIVDVVDGVETRYRVPLMATVPLGSIRFGKTKARRRA